MLSSAVISQRATACDPGAAGRGERHSSRAWLASMPPPEMWQTARTVYPGCVVRMQYRVSFREHQNLGLVQPGVHEQIVCVTVLPRSQHATPPPGVPMFGCQVEEGEVYWVMQTGTEDCAFATSKIETIVLRPALAALQQPDCPADISEFRP
jgi:hypothetical protein